jgi:hypothetical protein
MVTSERKATKILVDLYEHFLKRADYDAARGVRHAASNLDIRDDRLGNSGK